MGISPTIWTVATGKLKRLTTDDGQGHPIFAYFSAPNGSSSGLCEELSSSLASLHSSCLLYSAHWEALSTPFCTRLLKKTS
ncbi:unnamed protein product [Urochloa humidicola]